MTSCYRAEVAEVYSIQN